MKTRIFTRKRALISSVAMLLVAIIALGTATFAWFTKSTQATANDIAIATVKSSSLQVKNLEQDWNTAVSYLNNNSNYNKGGDGAGNTLLPASGDGTHGWYTAEAAASSAFTKAANGSSINSSDLYKYVFVDTLDIKNAGETKITNITIKSSITTAESTEGEYARIAIVPTNADHDKTPDGGTLGVFDDTTIFAKKAETYKPLTTGGADATSNITTGTFATLENTGISVPDLNGGDVAYYRVYVWFEGQDVDCKDAFAGHSLKGLKFTVSGKTAASA